MISAICWVPKEVSKAEPIVAEPPAQEELEEIIKSGVLEKRIFTNTHDVPSIDELQPFMVPGGVLDEKKKKKGKKVQSVAWNCHVPEVLLSGSFDHFVVMKDMRSPSHAGIRWSVPVDVESLAWDPHVEHSFLLLTTGSTDKMKIAVETLGFIKQPTLCIASKNPKAVWDIMSETGVAQVFGRSKKERVAPGPTT